MAATLDEITLAVDAVVGLTKPLIGKVPERLLFEGMRETYLDPAFGGDTLSPQEQIEALAGGFACVIVKLAAAQKELDDARSVH